MAFYFAVLKTYYANDTSELSYLTFTEPSESPEQCADLLIDAGFKPKQLEDGMIYVREAQGKTYYLRKKKKGPGEDAIDDVGYDSALKLLQGINPMDEYHQVPVPKEKQVVKEVAVIVNSSKFKPRNGSDH